MPDIILTSRLCFFLLTISCISYGDNTFQNGWIPSTRDNILNLLRINNEQNPTTSYNSAAIHLMKLTASLTASRNNEADDDNNKQDFSAHNLTEATSEGFHSNSYQTEVRDAKFDRSTFARKAKGITENSYNKLKDDSSSKDANNVIDEELTDDQNIDANKTSVHEEKSGFQDYRRTYEVTEDLFDNENIKNESPVFGYNYNLPEYKKPSPNRGNLTGVLFDILSRYNIKTNDYLPNYNISRQLKNQYPLREEVAYPYPLRIKTPNGSNNFNHLPVNPLMAVFLSNYGFYLPGLYGIQRNYNNLYGYLASNNMHNNRPFGEYKIFSDTDSSN